MDLARRRGTESIRPELRQRSSGAKERPLELAAPVGVGGGVAGGAAALRED